MTTGVLLATNDTVSLNNAISHTLTLLLLSYEPRALESFEEATRRLRKLIKHVVDEAGRGRELDALGVVRELDLFEATIKENDNDFDPDYRPFTDEEAKYLFGVPEKTDIIFKKFISFMATELPRYGVDTSFLSNIISGATVKESIIVEQCKLDSKLFYDLTRAVVKIASNITTRDKITNDFFDKLSNDFLSHTLHHHQITDATSNINQALRDELNDWITPGRPKSALIDQMVESAFFLASEYKDKEKEKTKIPTAKNMAIKLSDINKLSRPDRDILVNAYLKYRGD